MNDQQFQNRPPARETQKFMDDVKPTLAIMQKDITTICEKLIEMNSRFNQNDKTREAMKVEIENISRTLVDFVNVRAIVYGVVKIIVVAVILALIGLVVMK
jgi:hypothetical protein